MRDLGKFVFRSLAEIFTFAAFVAGWLLITSAIVALTSPLAWRFSLGLLAIALGGIQLLARLVWHGLYMLTRSEKLHG